MASLSPETGNDEGAFWWQLAGTFVSLCIAFSMLAWVSLPMPLALRVALGALLALATYAVLCTVALFIGLLVAGAFAAAERATLLATEAAGRSMTLLIEAGKPFLLGLIGLPFLPFVLGCRWLYGRTVLRWIEHRRELSELRKLFEEFRDRYATFEDFRRDFASGGTERARRDEETQRNGAKDDDPPKAQPPDKFAEACRVLGLAADGRFSEAELKARFHALMKAVHPDIVGQSTLAAQLNAARDLIKLRKGWN